MQFTQTAGVAELYVAADAGAAPAGRLLLLLPQGAATPATLSFADAWAGSGAFLFVAAAVPDAGQAAFAAAARTFLADPRLAGTRVAWLAPLDASGVLRGTTLAVAGAPGAQTVAFTTVVRLRSLGLALPAGASIAVDDVADELVIAGPGVALTAGWGGVAAGTVVGGVHVGFGGALQGCLRCALEAAEHDLDALDVGLRTFYALPPSDASAPAAPSAAGFFLASQRYPLLQGAATLYPSLDPLAPLDGTRTFLAFAAADAGLSGGAPPAVGSYLRSTLGDAFALTPLTGAAAPTRPAALVLVPRQAASAASPRDPLYLAPAGDFALATKRTGPASLIGGLSGVECFTVPETGGVVSFLPGGAAFAAGFVPGEPAGATTLTPTDTPTTSYAWIGVPDATVDYYAQPDQSVLYNYGAASVAGVTTVTPLAAVPVLAATLAWPPDPAHAFPLLPYAGLGGGSLDGVAQLEAQVLSPLRRGLLRGAPASAPSRAEAASSDPVSAVSTTPQGLLASYAPGGSPTTWDSIVLGRMSVPQPSPPSPPPPAPPTPQDLCLRDVDGDLLAAFQSNQLFLVVTDPEAIKRYLAPADALVTIGDDPRELWRFDLDPAGWSADTVLIVKFADRSIEELLGRPDAWASARTFNTDPAAASAAIAAAIAASDGGEYADFRAAVSDRSWNGILALNVPSPLSGLPAELQGLAAGIDPARFRAHHVGIAASKVIVPDPASGQSISVEDSSIFALIDYRAPAPLPVQGGDWLFQVATLTVRFASSAVAAFASTVDLEVNTLFGEAATLQGAPDNVLELSGVYQKHTVNGQVVGSYTFETAKGQTAVFAMEHSPVLNAVVVGKVQFVTLTAETTATNVDAQFQIWGALDFRALSSADATSFDVFSFGREQAGDPASGLAFGNLVLNMAFDPAVQPEVPTFTFDASALALDIASSTPRAGSLFSHLPLTVARVSQATQGAAPQDLGFMGVQTPLVQSALAFPWFSLDFDLNLGTAGALAAEAGFVATLTAAWSPTDGADPHVFVGLKLPGSSGAKRAISIQSVLDIGFKSIEIVAPAPDTFVLVLYGIGFEFLRFTFPPAGQVNFALFGDPQAQGKGDASLGWYAAYGKAAS